MQTYDLYILGNEVSTADSRFDRAISQYHKWCRYICKMREEKRSTESLVSEHFKLHEKCQYNRRNSQWSIFQRIYSDSKILLPVKVGVGTRFWKISSRLAPFCVNYVECCTFIGSILLFSPKYRLFNFGYNVYFHGAVGVIWVWDSLLHLLLV